MRVAGTILILLLLAGGHNSSARQLLADNRPEATAVDLELALAVDVSYSMDMDELALQREGYADAIESPEFLSVLKAGMFGRIAVTYFEWAAAYDQKIIVPWRLIDGPETAAAVADEIRMAPIRRAARTSISGAIAYAMPLYDRSGYRGARRVIDISGDGPNNNGMPVTVARDEAIARGFTINGLPIMIRPVSGSMMDIENLDIYYEDCVIGGPGAFVIPAMGREHFKQAIRTKLVMEVAGVRPLPGETRPAPVAAAAPRSNCMIGEQLWRQRRFDP